jgi:serine O-acetyltransferase
MGFSAYGVTQGDDPVAMALKGLIDHAAGHEHQIALLRKAIEQLSRNEPSDGATGPVMPQDAQTGEHFDAERLNQLVK